MCGRTVRDMVKRSVGNVMSAKKMFYSMGEVSEMFDVNPSLIRHWESKFDCLRPHKNKKGNRLFSPSDVEKLKQIYHLVKERGMTLEGANKAMKSSRGVLSRDTELLERLQRIRAALVEVREELRDGVQDDIVDEAESVDPMADAPETTLAADAVMAVEQAAATDAAAVESVVEDVPHAESENAGEKSVDTAAEGKSDDPVVGTQTESVAPAEASDGASAEASEADTVKPSAAAVSPKSRTRRRKKGDEEEKELFPFYEQSLF